MTTINETLLEIIQKAVGVLENSTTEVDATKFVRELNVQLRKCAKDHIAAEKAQKPKKINKYAYPCKCEGVQFKSIIEAGTFFNMHPNVVANRLRSEYWPEWVAASVEKTVTMREKKTEAKPVIIDGVEYASITEASKSLGTSVGSVFHKIHSTKYPEWKIK